MKPKQTEDVRVLNDGLHSKRALNTVRQLFTTHDLKDAVLYQFIASGSQDREVYQATMKSLIRHIRTKCRAEYIGAYEVGEEKSGLHTHAFVIIETAKHFPSDLLDVSEGKFIARLRKRKGISLRIEPPKNRMHGEAMFARMSTPAKLENCINWCTYILKPRSKDDVPGRETYFGSEFVSNITKREAQRQKYRDALLKSSKPTQTLTKETNDEASTTEKSEAFLPLGSPADQEETSSESRDSLVDARQSAHGSEEVRSESEASTDDERYSDSRISPYYERPEMRLTAAQKYLATLYEHCVDANMDTDEIRRYLLAKGVVRTPGQVAWELEHVFCFTRYADNYPPKPVMSSAEWDRTAYRLR
jgi:hypothetical protein